MANNVALSEALRSNLTSLQSTQSLMDKSQLILSTGRKVNSALDGAQAFFTAKSLNDRASDLSRLLDGLGQSISTIQSADQAVSALIKLVDQADALANQARDEISAASALASATGKADLSGVTDLDTDISSIVDTSSDTFTVSVAKLNTAAAVTADTKEVDIGTSDTVADLTTAINDLGGSLDGLISASQNTSGQLKLDSLSEGNFIRLGGTGTGGNNDLSEAAFEALGLGDFVKTEDTVATTRVAGTIVAGNTLTSYAASTTDVTTSTTLADAGFLSGLSTSTGTDAGTFQLTVDGTAGTAHAINATTTIGGFVDAINGDTALAGKVTASFDANTAQFSLTVSSDVTNVEITVDATGIDTDADGFDVNFGFASGAADAGDGDATYDGFGAVGDTFSEFITFSGKSADTAQLQTDYNEVRNQIDALVEDASYRGINLLENDNLTTAFNEDRSNTLVTEGVDFTANGLGISRANFTTASFVDASLTELREAKNSARDFGQSIANDLAVIQTREEFTTATINTLETGADKLTLADQNEESARMLALQTRQQIGFISLSLASQSQQGILRLF